MRKLPLLKPLKDREAFRVRLTREQIRRRRKQLRMEQRAKLLRLWGHSKCPFWEFYVEH